MMRDGHTRSLTRMESEGANRSFMDDNRVTLVVINGPAAGSEFVLDRERTVIGRGPGVDLPFRDSAMSREHLAIEMLDDRCRARDLASTNGIRVNESAVLVADLKHGDTLEVGEHRFQVIVEEAERSAGTYLLPDG